MFARLKKVLKYGLIWSTSVTLTWAGYIYLFKYDKFQQMVLKDLQERQGDGRSQESHFSAQQIEKWNKSVDQPWGFQPILQLDFANKETQSGKQMSQEDKKKNVVFIFTKTKHQHINQQVKKMAQQFVNRYFQNICQKFQFILQDQGIFTEYNDPQKVEIYAQKDGRQLKIDIEDQIINRNKQRTFQPNYQPIFTQMLQILGSTPEISAQNINQFIQQISTEREGIVPIKIMLSSYNSTAQSKDYTKGFMSFIAKFYGLVEIPGTQAVVPCDQVAKTILGLNTIQGLKSQSAFYFLTPLNRNVFNLQQKQIIKINGKKFALLNSSGAHNKMVFSPVPSKMPKDRIIMTVNIDLNKAKSNQLDHLYSQLAKQSCKQIFKMVSYQTSKNPIQIFVQNKRIKRQMKDVYQFPTGRREQEIRDLLSTSSEWKYPHEEIKAEKILKFFQEVKQSIKNNQKSPYEYNKSQQSTERKFSVPLVGQQVKKTIQKNNYYSTDSVVFHYSKNCHSCNKFKGYYEQIALQNFNVNFYRIDNDTNKIQGMKSYNSTPIFAMYKHQLPLVPWHYKMPYFTKSLFENFIKIVNQVKPIDISMIQKNVRMHEECKKDMTQLLKDVQNYQIIEKKSKINIQEPIKRQLTSVVQEKIQISSQKKEQKVEQTKPIFQQNHQSMRDQQVTVTASEQHLLDEFKVNSKVDQL